MSYPLYHHNGNYFLLINKGSSFSYVVDFHSYNYKLIDNQTLDECGEIDFSRENLESILTSLGKIKNAHLDDFDKYQYEHCIDYCGSTYYVKSWRDIMNIIKGR